MIKLTETVAYATLDLVSATLLAMIEDGEYEDAMSRFTGPARDQDCLDHQTYANSLVVAHHDLIMQLKSSHSIIGIKVSKMKHIDHWFGLPPAFT